MNPPQAKFAIVPIVQIVQIGKLNWPIVPPEELLSCLFFSEIHKSQATFFFKNRKTRSFRAGVLCTIPASAKQKTDVFGMRWSNMGQPAQDLSASRWSFMPSMWVHRGGRCASGISEKVLESRFLKNAQDESSSGEIRNCANCANCANWQIELANCAA